MSIHTLKQRIAELEAGLREAMEWNWLDGDVPISVLMHLVEIAKLAPPKENRDDY